MCKNKTNKTKQTKQNKIKDKKIIKNNNNDKFYSW